MRDSVGRLGREVQVGTFRPFFVILLGLAVVACFTLHAYPTDGPRANSLSVLGLVVPLDAPWLPTLSLWARRIFLLSAALWMCGFGVRWMGWLAALSFTVAGSVWAEGYEYVHHQYHVLAVSLWLFAAWTCFHREPGRPAFPWKLQRVPCWVWWCGCSYLATTYSWSGASKLAAHGFGWADGASLQLWMWSWGMEGSLWKWVSQQRTLMQAAQLAVLCAESLAWVALFSRRVRRVIGIVLLGFHVMVEVVAGFGFYTNIIAVAVFFLLPHDAERCFERSPAASPSDAR